MCESKSQRYICNYNFNSPFQSFIKALECHISRRWHVLDQKEKKRNGLKDFCGRVQLYFIHSRYNTIVHTLTPGLKFISLLIMRSVVKFMFFESTVLQIVRRHGCSLCLPWELIMRQTLTLTLPYEWTWVTWSPLLLSSRLPLALMLRWFSDKHVTRRNMSFTFCDRDRIYSIEKRLSGALIISNLKTFGIFLIIFTNIIIKRIILKWWY